MTIPTLEEMKGNEDFAKLARGVKTRIEQQRTPNEEGANKALEILIQTHNQELQQAITTAKREADRCKVCGGTDVVCAKGVELQIAEAKREALREVVKLATTKQCSYATGEDDYCHGAYKALEEIITHLESELSI